MSHGRKASSAPRGRGAGGTVDSDSLVRGCHKQGLRCVSTTTRGSRPTRGDRVVSRHAVAFAAAVSRARRQHDACRIRASFWTGPSQTQSDTVGHDLTHSCSCWALPGRGCGGWAPPRSQLLVVGPAREGIWRDGSTTLAAVGGGPCPGGDAAGGHHHARSSCSPCFVKDSREKNGVVRNKIMRSSQDSCQYMVYQTNTRSQTAHQFGFA